MKTFIGIFLCLCLVSCERFSVPNESQAGRNTVLTTDEYFSSDSSFYIQNKTHVNIGLVGIRLIDSTTTWINVPDSGTYSVHLPHVPTYCLIHGYTLLYSAPEWISIDLHRSVHAGWTTNVVIVDQSEQS